MFQCGYSRISVQLELVLLLQNSITKDSELYDLQLENILK